MENVSVAAAKEIALEWILEVGCKEPGAIGAVLTGSINWMRPDADFPASSDVDISVVFEDGAELRRFGLFDYRGLMLEASANPLGRFTDVDALLADYRRSPGLWRRGVAVDRTGRLTEIQNRIEAEFEQPRWVNLRIEDAAANCIGYFDRLSEADPFAQQIVNWVFAEGVMCHVLLTGGFRNPTVRRRYSETKYLMEAVHRVDVHERLLTMLGCDELSADRAEYHFAQMTAVFDATKSLSGTPFPFERDITEVARPIAVTGTDDLIRAGEHREAVFWMVVTLGRCLAMLRSVESQDAVLAENSLRNLLEDLGVTSWQDIESRAADVRDYLGELKSIAHEISVKR